jgi:serine/threonine protein kinase
MTLPAMASRLLAGRYRLQEPLGTSLMAEVHAAIDLVLDRTVVVKLLRADAHRDRFEREARAVAALAHPNIVDVFDYGEEDGRPYLVFEYLPGQSLHERLAAGIPLPDADTRRIAVDIAAGLAHAHERGVVHRDLKPANVLFDSEDRAKIADFGIAYVAEADTITDAGTVLGTAAYISPEQVRGEAVTPASDVYAFGVVLYQMLSGRLPFTADNPARLATMHRDFDPPPLASIRADAPAGLAALTEAALAKDPAARPPDGTSVAATLAAEAPPPTLSDVDTRVLPPAGSGSRRRALGILSGVVAVALLIAGAVAAVVLNGGNHSAPAQPVQRDLSKSTPTRVGVSTSATARPTSSSTTVQTGAARPATRPPSTGVLPPTTTAVLPTTTEATAPTTTEATTTVP